MYSTELMNKANRIIASCERDLGRTLTRGERTDLLCDNTKWTHECCANVAKQYGLLYGEMIRPKL